MPRTSWIVFTDLDGTFLNHDNYAFDAAVPVVKKLQHAGVPLIFVTSKTEPEVKKLQKKVGITTPFIVENGGAIFFPEEDDVIELGQRYETLTHFLNPYKEDGKVIGFDDMTVQDVMRFADLDEESATLSKERGYSEPFICEDLLLIEKMTKAATDHGLSITKGGRFYHVMAHDQNKAHAIAVLLDHYEKLGTTFKNTLSLGDSKNDFEMLACTSKSVLMPKLNLTYEKGAASTWQRASKHGADGWAEMVSQNIF